MCHHQKGEKIMKNVILFSLLLVLLCVHVTFAAASGEESTYVIYINGTRLKLSPLVKEEVLYLPVQVIASRLELNFEWNPALNTVKINDQLINAAPYVTNGMMYMPMESIAKAINATIKLDGKNRQVLINSAGTGGAQATAVQPPQTGVSKAIKVPPAAASGSSSGIEEIKSPPGAQAQAPVILQGQGASQQGQAPAGMTDPAAQPKGQPFKLKKSYEEIASGKIQRMMGNLNNIPDMGGKMPFPELPGTNQAPSSQPPTGQGSDANVQKQMEAGRDVYPSPSAYPGTSTRGGSQEIEPVFRPLNAPPAMPDGLKLPPTGPHFPGNIPEPQTPAEMTSTPMFPSATSFTPKKAENKVFSITITNIEQANTLKSYYKPNAGGKYVVIYLSQQNISNLTQVYTGKFSLIDGDNKVYEYMEGLSNFWLVILKPGAINFGYLVFEVPQGAAPNRLVLHALNQEPFFVKLD
jgi:hypothetical protein